MGVLITARVHPRASHARSSWKDDVLELWVSSPPVGGSANKAVLAAVARHFDVPESRVGLRSGARSRRKVWRRNLSSRCGERPAPEVGREESASHVRRSAIGRLAAFRAKW
jgi:uncharacterized protein YggU (UPF0235/DUF167 family)